MGKGFDLGAALADVSKLDTGREQITYLDLDLLTEDPNNFYSTDGIEALAESIEFIGLQQPLRVRPDPNQASRYRIVSGHRRYQALRMIAASNEKFRQVPCIVEQSAQSDAMQELRLIYANSDTRTMTTADLAKQAKRVETLLYELQQQGVEFPGRMRDHVAEVCKISASKLARLKVIREKLHPLLKKYWDDGKMNESTAYACASAGQGVQADLVHYIGADKVATMYEWTLKKKIDAARKIRKRECKKCDGGCLNADAMLEKTLPSNYSECEYYCCADCPNLSHCRSVCSVMAEKAADLKQQRKDAQQTAKRLQEDENRRKVDNKRMIWQRWDAARRAANKTVEDGYRVTGKLYGSGSEQQAIGYADGSVEIKASTPLPYSYHDLDAYEPLIKTADLFGCSLDYLLGRMDDPTPGAGSPTWRPGLPEQSGSVVARLQNGPATQTRVCWFDADDQVFRFSSDGETITAECLGWLPIPE